MRIGVNVPSLNAYSNMKKAYNKLSIATNDLSSGIRLNSSKVDPAALAIANKMQMQHLGLVQASQNTSNGVSLVQTAEGALGQVEDMIQRIRELAVFAANDTNETDDREKMQGEINQLINEIDAISTRTEYNKIKVLNGEGERLIRAKDMNVLSLSEHTPYGDLKFTADSLATQAKYDTSTATSWTAADSIAYQGKTISVNGFSFTIEASDTPASINQKFLEAGAFTGVTFSNDLANDIPITEAISPVYGSKSELRITSTDNALLEKLGVVTSDGAIPPNYTHNITAGEDATITLDTTDSFTTNATYKADGNTITIRDSQGVEVRLKLDPNMATKPAPGAPVDMILTTKPGSLVIQIGPNKDMGMLLNIPKVNSETIGIERMDVLTSKSATNSIDIADEALSRISEIRSRLGAYQNRMEHAVASLDGTAVDTEMSLSRIRDTDMAKAMTEYSKNNVIYQAGNSILAQSNMRPQSILQLMQ